MKLLILPSHRLILCGPKNSLTLLPEYLRGQEYCAASGIIATLHYKTVSVFRSDSLIELANNLRSGSNVQKLLPIIEQTMNKKIAVLDIFDQIVEGKSNPKCILSDKFGDLYRLPLVLQASEPVYLNSNLGIPNFIRNISTKGREYLLLSDEENRIKIYDSQNPHDLISFWFLISQSSIQCSLLEHKNGTSVVLLVRYEDKSTLQTEIRLHSFEGTEQNLHADQYPGKEIKSNLKLEKGCLFYTMIDYKNLKGEKGVIILYLYKKILAYEVFISNDLGILMSNLSGNITIEQGHWDYLHAVTTEKQIIVAYGSDVDVPTQIEGSHTTLNFSQIGTVTFNKYEHIIRIDLHQ